MDKSASTTTAILDMGAAAVTKQPGRLAILLAFGAVYVFWGATYLGIRFAIESIPPMLMAGSRFTLAGLVLLLIGRLRGGLHPTAAEWRGAAITGALLIGVGNGGVTWSEQTVPSGIAAIVASVVPLWMTLMDWARPGGRRPASSTIAGLILGMVGLVVLIGGGAGAEATEGPGSLLNMAILVCATIGWALGSVIASYVRMPGSPLMAIGAQMTVGGAVLLVIGFLAGEGPAFDWSAITGRSFLAWGYLVVFGSWVGFSAYVWLLRNTTPAKVSTYAFVNPLVALGLGVWLASEPITGRTVVAVAIILTGVALIVVNRGKHTPNASGDDLPTTADVVTPARPGERRRTAKGGIAS